MQIIIMVTDQQDSPPFFVDTKPLTVIPSTAKSGDPLTVVAAVDGDKGNPREIRYSLKRENNDFLEYFSLDEKT
ncbi:unnamed protein product, partial [Cyprideis torosa]